MAVRRQRVSVVLDTNVLAAALLSRDLRSPNSRMYRMWGDRQIQLVVSDDIEREYLAVLARLEIPSAQIQRFALRLRTRATVSHVRPSRLIRLSRDPSDNPFLAAAAAGKAQFLVTNDQDLLLIPSEMLRPFPFRILRPQAVLSLLRKGFGRR